MVQHLSHDHECISMSLENPEIFNKVCATLIPSNHQCPLYTHIVGYIHVYVASRLTAFEMLTWQKVGMPSKHLEKCTWVWSCLVVLYISYPKVKSPQNHYFSLCCHYGCQLTEKTFTIVHLDNWIQSQIHVHFPPKQPSCYCVTCLTSCHISVTWHQNNYIF